MIAFASVAAGLCLIAMALWDMFHTLFHPMGHGSLSGFIMNTVWPLFRAIGKRWHRGIALAGAAMLIITCATWTVMLVTGFALLYAPFIDASVLRILNANRPVGALYLSSATITTLSSSTDLLREYPLLRFISCFEALFGLGLATAGISWILSLQPILRKRRAFAHQSRVCLEALHEHGGLAGISAKEASEIFHELTGEISQVRTDLMHVPGAYYYHSDDDRMSIPEVMPGLVALSHEAARLYPPEEKLLHVRLSAFTRALDDLAQMLRDSYLCDEEGAREPAEKTLHRWRKDQLREG